MQREKSRVNFASIGDAKSIYQTAIQFAYGDAVVTKNNGVLGNEALHAAGAILDAECGAVGNIGG